MNKKKLCRIILTIGLFKFYITEGFPFKSFTKIIVMDINKKHHKKKKTNIVTKKV